MDIHPRHHHGNHRDDLAAKAVMDHNGLMKQLLRLLQRWTGKRVKPPLHTPEELECFKADAIDNHGKHY